MHTFLRRPFPQTILLVFTICLAASDITVHGQDIEIVFQEATAKVDLHLREGTFSVSGSDEDEIVDPNVEFSAYAHATTSPFTTFFGQGAAYQDQFGINAVYLNSEQALADARNFSGSARTVYESTVRSRRTYETSDGTIPFTFVINSGEVRLKNFAALDINPLTSVVNVTAEIIVDGNIWRFTTGIEKDFSGALVERGSFFGNIDTYGLNIFPDLDIIIDGNEAYIDIPRIEGTIDMALRDFNFGVDFRYEMTAEINITDSFAVSAFAGITDPFALGTLDPGDDLGGPFSPLGVQFFLNNVPMSSFPIVVPEPYSAVMMLLGCCGLILRYREPK